MEVIRVGEGHYSPMNQIPPEHKAAIARVLVGMRQVTYRLTINGEVHKDGHRYRAARTQP